jgi:DNA repair protein RadC
MKKYRYPTETTARIIVSLVCEDSAPPTAVDSPERIYEFWKAIIEEQPDHESDKESLVVILLNRRLRAYAWHRVSLGTVDSCTAHPRDILRPVIVAGAYGFALMHNHPSGDPTPSQADTSLTRRIAEASNLMQVKFLDHVVVGKPAPGRAPYYSFRESGYISD